LDEIQNELKDMRADVGASDPRPYEERGRGGVVRPRESAGEPRQSLGTYNDSLAKVRIELASLHSEVDSYEAARKAGGDVLAVASVAQTRASRTSSGSGRWRRRSCRRIELEKKPGHPEYLAKLSEIEKISKRIDGQLDTIYEKLKTRLRLAERNESYLVGQIHRTEEEGYRVKQASSSYELQKADAANQRKVYDFVAETMNRLSVTAQLVSMNNNLSILDRPPSRAIPSSRGRSSRSASEPPRPPDRRDRGPLPRLPRQYGALAGGTSSSTWGSASSASSRGTGTVTPSARARRSRACGRASCSRATTGRKTSCCSPPPAPRKASRARSRSSGARWLRPAIAW
jgi:hypothetical protein